MIEQEQMWNTDLVESYMLYKTVTFSKRDASPILRTHRAIATPSFFM